MIDLNLKPSDRELRLFGGLWLPIFLLLLAGWRHLSGSPGSLPLLLMGGAVVSVAIALPRPRWITPIWVVLMVAVFPIGFVVSHVILGLIYYGVVSPLGLALRLAGKDLLHRRMDPEAETYWVEREDEPDTMRYFRQF